MFEKKTYEIGDTITYTEDDKEYIGTVVFKGPGHYDNWVDAWFPELNNYRHIRY